MARPRDISTLTPAYRKRLESAFNRGLNRSQARGHARIHRGELTASTLRSLTTRPQHETVLLRRVIASGDPIERMLYEQAKREKFRAKKPWSDEPASAKDRLLTWQRGKHLLEDAEFTEYPGEAFTNIEDINVFESVLDDLEQFETTPELEERIGEIREALTIQKRELRKQRKINPKRWGEPPKKKRKLRKKK